MKKRIWVFVFILMSFITFVPVYATDPSYWEVSIFQKMFFGALEKAESELNSRYIHAGYENIMEIEGATAVVGDLHGDLDTFRRIRDYLSWDLLTGRIQNVVFLGDIMDRGSNSANVLLELLGFFNRFPGRIFILRGNHETMDIFENFGDECNPARNDPYFKGIDRAVFRRFFDSLPYAILINGHTLAVHGGIPHRDLWDGFYGLGRPREGSEMFKIVHSTTWADYSPSGDAVTPNKSRCGDIIDPKLICFSEDVVREFFAYHSVRKKTATDCRCNIKCLKYLIRAHQPSREGSFYQSPNGIVTTVFSAIENQGVLFKRFGASVALVTKEDRPPTKYLSVYPF